MHDPGVKWTGFGSRLRGYQPLVWGMTGFQVISKILIYSYINKDATGIKSEFDQTNEN